MKRKIIIRVFSYVIALLIFSFFVLSNGAAFFSLERAEADALNVVKQALESRELSPDNLLRREISGSERGKVLSFYGVAWQFDWIYRDERTELYVIANIFSDGFVDVHVINKRCTYEMVVDESGRTHMSNEQLRECKLNYPFEGWPKTAS